MNTLISAGIVMSTIHSTFNRVNTSYTVIGAHKQSRVGEKNEGLSILLLNRGVRPFREEIIKKLLTLDIAELISIETGTGSHGSIEKECLDNEKLRFLLLKDKVSPGEMVNIGILESTGDSIMVLWDDMDIDVKSISYRVFEKIREDSIICTVPVFKTSNGETVPTFMTPLFNKGLLKVVPLDKSPDLKTLYPYEYSGIYNRELFIRLGGYDIDIKNSYWQKLDFGLRANMWGEEIKAHNSFSVFIEPGKDRMEDITPDRGYRLYSLKNLSVIIKRGTGYLPLRRFFQYYEKSGSSFNLALKTFLNVRKWVKINRFRFKFDAPSLTENWDTE